MKRIVIILSLLIAAFDVCGQELTVKSMEVAPMDLSASTQPRNDRNGNPCALVKVLMVDGIDRVEGNVIGDVEDRGTEKWVYLSAGTKMVKIVPKSHLPLMIMFDDYGIKKVESKVTYTLALVEPALEGQEAEYSMKTVSLDEIEGLSDEAISQLAYDYFWGNNGKSVDYDKAAAFYQQAANHGYAYAQLQLGVCFEWGKGVPQNYEQAVYWYQKASEKDMRGTLYLGYMYERGNGVQQSYEKALSLGQKAADAGIANAERFVGGFYYLGHAVEKDFSKAVYWFERSANQGLVSSLTDLGNIYYIGGYGVKRDFEKALAYYQQAADKGNEWGIMNVGMCYEQGKGVKKDLGKAEEYYRKASQLGNKAAEGWCYYYGKGKEQNYQKAFRLFKESAEENHSDLAQYYLGECYANGHGTFPNASLAVEWYKKSAEAYYLPALMRLGECYENGTGVQKDKNQSRQWYRQAAEMGDQDAKKKLK